MSIQLRRKAIGGSLVYNSNFEYAPPFTAITTGGNVWVNGTAAGSASDDSYGFYKITGVGAFAASFDSVVKTPGSNYSMKIEATNATGRGRIMNTPFETTTTKDLVQKYGAPCTPATDYQLTAMVKTNNVPANSLKIAIQFFRADGTQISTVNSAFFPSTQDFTPYSAVITSPALAAFFRLSFEISVAGTICQAWLDDFSMSPMYLDDRPGISGKLVKNGNFQAVPTLTAPGTTTGRFIDGTAAGSTTNSTYKWSQIIDATSCAISIDSTVTYQGRASLKVDCLDATGRGRGVNGSRTGTGTSLLVTELNTYGIRVAPNTSYTLRYRVKTKNVQGSGAKIAVHEHDPSGVRNTSSSATAVPGTTSDFQLIEYTFTTQPTTCYLVLSAEIATAGAIQTAWFAAVTIDPTVPPVRTEAARRLLVRDFGTGLFFIGGNDVTKASGVFTNFSTTDYSVSLWLKAPLVSSNVAANTGWIFGTGGSTTFMTCTLRNSMYNFRYFDANDDRSATTPQIPNAWTHLACTVSSVDQKLRIYANGVLGTLSAAINSRLDLTQTRIVLGKGLDGFGALTGAMDDVRVFRGKTLSQSEVTELYYDGMSPGNELLIWDFNEGSGTAAIDSSGNGNDGVITGSVYTADVPMYARTAV